MLPLLPRCPVALPGRQAAWWEMRRHSHCGGPKSRSSLQRQRHLYLLLTILRMCLSPDGRQLRWCGGHYAFMSLSKHLLALIIQLGEEGAVAPAQPWLLTACHRLGCRHGTHTASGNGLLSGDTCFPRLASCHVPLPAPPTREIKVEEPKAHSRGPSLISIYT